MTTDDGRLVIDGPAGTLTIHIPGDESTPWVWAELDKKYPGAAASLREGMDETLTILRLDVPPTLARSLRSTNLIESMISICRDHAANVKNWKDGTMALRWCAAGMAEAGKQFRRVNGFPHLPKLRIALERHVAPQSPTSNCYNENVA